MINQRRSGKWVFVMRIVINQYDDHAHAAWAKWRGLNVTAVSTQGNHRSLTHCGRVTQICVFNTVKLGTSASSP